MNFKKAKVLDKEFVDALVSLSAIHDSAKCDRPSAGISGHNIDEGFYFMCGWDRLMARFKMACADRDDNSVLYHSQYGTSAYV